MIEAKNLTKRYDMGSHPVFALKNADIEVEKGEFIAVTGPSGSGKSTFLNIIGCLDRPTAGRYFLNGIDTGILSPDSLSRLRNSNIGFIFQGFNLLARLTALENVQLPLVYRGVPKRQRHEMAMDALSSVGLADRCDHLPSQLSGGQQQRVAIARAISGNPPLLLADEPTGNLDSKSGETVLSLIREIHDKGATILLITHDPAIALIAKRQVVIRDGVLQ
ncbi:MAG: ABC transporter ATP-binding protein [Christensenellales bacterium]|jgi:putative ABC transport system ATP-binding protein